MKENSQNNEKKQTKAQTVIQAADSLSLGISIVVAIVIGFLIGYGFWKLTGSIWAMIVGVAFGVGAAINNVYLAYKKDLKSLNELKEKEDKAYEILRQKKENGD